MLANINPKWSLGTKNHRKIYGFSEWFLFCTIVVLFWRICFVFWMAFRNEWKLNQNACFWKSFTAQCLTTLDNNKSVISCTWFAGLSTVTMAPQFKGRPTVQMTPKYQLRLQRESSNRRETVTVLFEKFLYLLKYVKTPGNNFFRLCSYDTREVFIGSFRNRFNFEAVFHTLSA